LRELAQSIIGVTFLERNKPLNREAQEVSAVWLPEICVSGSPYVRVQRAAGCCLVKIAQGTGVSAKCFEKQCGFGVGPSEVGMARF
jgi:hypothetical protein